MKITRDIYLGYLITFFKARKWHSDFHELHKQQLNILNKYLNIPGKVVLDYTSKSLNFYGLKNINRAQIFGIGKLDYPTMSDNEISSIVRFANLRINQILEKIESIYPLCSGEMTTSKENELVKEAMHYFINNKVINSHEKQILETYKEMLLNLINLLYGVESYARLEELEHASFNVVVKDPNDLDILQKRLHVEDYF